MIGAASRSAAGSSSNNLIAQFEEDSLIRGLTVETTRRYISALKIFNSYLEETGRDILEVNRDTLKGSVAYRVVETKMIASG